MLNKEKESIKKEGKLSPIADYRCMNCGYESGSPKLCPDCGAGRMTEVYDKKE